MDALVQSIFNGKQDFTQEEIWHLAGLTIDHYRASPNVVTIPSQNLIFVGDLHGELQSVLSVQRYIEKYNNHYFIFLGDYADRGPEQVETINLVMALNLAYPDRVLLLRGNHESNEIAARYGFYHAVLREFSVDVFKYYSSVFEVLPIAAYREGFVFGCHGGVPEGVASIEEIQARNRRNPNFPDDVIFQLVWNDPREGNFKFYPNERSSRARHYGQIAFDTFMENINAQVMFRAHEVIPEGYCTFFQKRLVSVFTATYMGRVRPKIVRIGSSGVIEPLDIR
ncbi:MAG: serine/threonine protein phosphatase [Candidatus Thorarchaeota archaeon]|nr:serine/threonine protein phosphatase [Candidatus Thorarchaeota archaeon]